MNPRQLIGPLLLAYAGAYLFAVDWLGLAGLQASIIFGETFILLTILLWQAKSADMEGRA